MKQHPKLIAITGGRSAGKSWVARHLQQLLGPDAVRLSQEEFYHIGSGASALLHDKINPDHPRSIDWELFETALRQVRTGREVRVPGFSSPTQTRFTSFKTVKPSSVVLVDGLWLLCRRTIRSLFDFSVYLDCPAQLRLERQIARNGVGPDADADASRRHFWKDISPMHDRFVAPEARWADLVLAQPSSDSEIDNLAEMIRALVAEDQSSFERELDEARSLDLWSGSELAMNYRQAA